MAHSPDVSVGDRIRARRLVRGWSIRHAAQRAGLAASTWSRIERGLLGADNRFTLSDIAAALECPVTDLTGRDTPTTRDEATRQALVTAIRRALIEVDLVEDPWCEPRSTPWLRQELGLLTDLHHRCDYLGVAQRLPTVLREVHAAAHGPDRGEALRLLVRAHALAGGAVRYLGVPTAYWLAAERERQAAEALDDPVLVAQADFDRAHAASTAGGYERGLRIARRAARELEAHTSQPGGWEVLGMLALTQALCAVGSHDPATAAEQTALAEEIAARTGETQVMMFGPTNVQFWRVSMLTDGGDPEEAARVAATVNPTIVPSRSRQVAFFIDHGRALSRLGRVEPAVRTLLAAERLAPVRVRANTLVGETARSLAERVKRNAVGTQLRGLCERVGVPA